MVIFLKNIILKYYSIKGIWFWSEDKGRKRNCLISVPAIISYKIKKVSEINYNSHNINYMYFEIHILRISLI